VRPGRGGIRATRPVQGKISHLVDVPERLTCDHSQTRREFVLPTGLPFPAGPLLSCTRTESRMHRSGVTASPAFHPLVAPVEELFPRQAAVT
jgi:hypothetical protein